MGNFSITVNARVNLPPSEVGDNSLTTGHAVTITFTEADFTTNTTPAYADPEGDLASELRVISLPANGALNLNGAPVTLNQVIPFTAIAASQFTYVPDAAIITLRTVDFGFEIADAGSGQFVG